MYKCKYSIEKLHDVGRLARRECAAASPHVATAVRTVPAMFFRLG